MREVEVKYRIRETETLLAALKKRGIELGAPVRQDDQAYAPDGWAYGDARLGVPFARLRTAEGQHTFTLKRPAENTLSCEEHETAVTERDQMHNAILAMGFYPTVRIVKNRRTGTLGDLVLCLDELDGLGVFLEVERMVADNVSGDAVQAELSRFVASLVSRPSRLPRPMTRWCVIPSSAPAPTKRKHLRLIQPPSPKINDLGRGGQLRGPRSRDRVLNNPHCCTTPQRGVLRFLALRSAHDADPRFQPG